VSQETYQPPAKDIELVVAAHVAIFNIGVSWAFGGNADWVRTPLSVWGSLGILITLAIVTKGSFRASIASGTLCWIWPIIVLNAVVALSCLTPAFQTLAFENDTLFIPKHVDWWIPSVTRTDLALRALWLFDGIYFSCINIALAIKRRRTIRLMLATVAGNALLLSLFGIVQKVFGSTGIYFGLVEVPHPQFFASFVYDNHWGAFTIIMIGACIGLVLRYAHGSRGEGFFHGPAFAGVTAVLLMSLSIPLSGSRACSLLLVVMICMALVNGAPTVSAALRLSGASSRSVMFGMSAAFILAVCGVWLVAGDVIQARAQKTREQVSEMWVRGGAGSRIILYEDTIRMVRERPLFGWGMGSYPVVFSVFNTQESEIDHLPVIYHDAHSDWLQAAAELGLVGALLIGVSVALPALALRRAKVTPIPLFLFTGCSLVAAYAWIEFPFGNVAVVLAWWLCFFSAVQYVRLTNRTDGGSRGQQ
jgi:O-antigen ligase